MCYVVHRIWIVLFLLQCRFSWEKKEIPNSCSVAWEFETANTLLQLAIENLGLRMAKCEI